MGRILEDNYPFNRAPVYNQAPRTSFFPKSNHQSGTRRIARSLPWGSISRRPPRGLPSARPDHQLPRTSPPLTPALLTPATAPLASARAGPCPQRQRRGQAPSVRGGSSSRFPPPVSRGRAKARSGEPRACPRRSSVPRRQPRTVTSASATSFVARSAPSCQRRLAHARHESPPCACSPPARVFDMFSGRGKV